MRRYELTDPEEIAAVEDALYGVRCRRYDFELRVRALSKIEAYGWARVKEIAGTHTDRRKAFTELALCAGLTDEEGAFVQPLLMPGIVAALKKETADAQG